MQTTKIKEYSGICHIYYEQGNRTYTEKEERDFF